MHLPRWIKECTNVVVCIACLPFISFNFRAVSLHKFTKTSAIITSKLELGSHKNASKTKVFSVMSCVVTMGWRNREECPKATGTLCCGSGLVLPASRLFPLSLLLLHLDMTSTSFPALLSVIRTILHSWGKSLYTVLCQSTLVGSLMNITVIAMPCFMPTISDG